MRQASAGTLADTRAPPSSPGSRRISSLPEGQEIPEARLLRSDAPSANHSPSAASASASSCGIRQAKTANQSTRPKSALKDPPAISHRELLTMLADHKNKDNKSLSAQRNNRCGLGGGEKVWTNQRAVQG